MKYVVCIAFIFCYHGSRGQQPFGEQLKSARFEIVKSTVEFLATDNETFRDVKSTLCNSCESYDDIEKFIRDNRLTGASALVRGWKNAPLDSSFARGMIDLEEFRGAVISKIAGPSKQRRRELPGYEAYTKKLDGIVSGVVGNKKNDSPAAAVLADEEQEEPLDARDTTATAGTASPLAGTVPTPAKSTTDLQPYLTYGAAGLFALLAFYFYRRNLDMVQKNEHLERMRKDLTEAQSSIEQRNRKLEAEARKREADLKEARNQNEQLLEKLKIERDKNEAIPATPRAAPPKSRTAETIAAQPPQKPAPVTRFARYADQGDGFSMADLLDQEDGETIFEITILSSTDATFRVAGNESAQRFALSNVSYFLSKTCQYDAFPTDNHSIRTDSPGELKLQGNKWLITSPAKISFN